TLANCGDQLRQFRGTGAGLRLFFRKFDLEHDVESAAGVVETARQLRGIDGLDAVEKLRGAARFVGLQMPYQVKARGLEVRHRGSLLVELLDVVFTELA